MGGGGGWGWEKAVKGGGGGEEEEQKERKYNRTTKEKKMSCSGQTARKTDVAKSPSRKKMGRKLERYLIFYQP